VAATEDKLMQLKRGAQQILKPVQEELEKNRFTGMFKEK